jgi:UDP-glucose 4-epimerase
MHPRAHAHGVDVEPASGRGPEANDELDLRTRKRDALHVAVALVHEQPGHPGGSRRAGRNAADGSDARLHERILVGCTGSRKLPRARVRFFQSVTGSTDQVPRMKILVTGATGKVGSRLTKRLAQRGDQIRAADLRGDRIELQRGDLLDAGSLAAAVRGVDAVVHCAAFFRGATPEQAHEVNDLGTQHLATAARAASVKRFVFTSTGLVYGPNGGRPAREDDPCAPLDAYPKSKLAAERFLLALEGLDVRVLRLPFVYGDGDPHIEEVVPLMQGFPPAQRLSIAHHVDVAQAVARMLDAPVPAHRVYNVVDDAAPDLAALFASVSAPPPDGSNAARARAFDALMDGGRLRQDLGFRPSFPRLADAVAKRA